MNFQKIRLAAGLYFVATPIGTARDITLRALDVLASADMIAAEDTRSLRRLMEIHGVPLEGRRILAYHDHSGAGARGKIMDALARQGQSVAYASEAGMPLIADPGYDLGRQAAEAGHAVTCAPGPSAALAALDLGGFADGCVLFCRFSAKCVRCAAQPNRSALRDIPGTLVFYESPKRVAACLSDSGARCLGGRPSGRFVPGTDQEIRRSPARDSGRTG